MATAPPAPIMEALQKMALTQDLGPQQLQKLAAMAAEAEFSEGDVIFREGDIGDTLYLVREGRVGVDMHVPGRGNVRIASVEPGQLLGWSALFAPMRKTATARVLAPTRAITLDAQALRRLCMDDRDLGCPIGWGVAGVIARRLKATRVQLLDIYSPSKSQES